MQGITVLGHVYAENALRGDLEGLVEIGILLPQIYLWQNLNILYQLLMLQGPQRLLRPFPDSRAIRRQIILISRI